MFSAPAYAEELLADNILVEKAKRKLTLLRDDKVIKTYRIALGKNPVGAKRRQGDNKTPEGHYIISGRKADSEFHLALQISYPDELDIERAEKQGVDPGDRIMIHGRPPDFESRRKRKRDWTQGCIAVTNREIEEIWNIVPDGTPIEIRP
jgi:murein L,D-transpeptidase YafK